MVFLFKKDRGHRRDGLLDELDGSNALGLFVKLNMKIIIT